MIPSQECEEIPSQEFWAIPSLVSEVIPFQVSEVPPLAPEAILQAQVVVFQATEMTFRTVLLHLAAGVLPLVLLRKLTWRRKRRSEWA